MSRSRGGHSDLFTGLLIMLILSSFNHLLLLSAETTSVAQFVKVKIVLMERLSSLLVLIVESGRKQQKIWQEEVELKLSLNLFSVTLLQSLSYFTQRLMNHQFQDSGFTTNLLV